MVKKGRRKRKEKKEEKERNLVVREVIVLVGTMLGVMISVALFMFMCINTFFFYPGPPHAGMIYQFVIILPFAVIGLLGMNYFVKSEENV